MSCRRSGLAGCDTCRDPATTGPGQQTKYTSITIRHKTNFSEIPQLESDIDEEEEGQFEDLQNYLTHHNTYQESQNIGKVLLGYRSCVQDLRPNSRPHTSQPSPQTLLYDAGAHTNIQQRKRSSPQGRAP